METYPITWPFDYVVWQDRVSKKKPYTIFLYYNAHAQQTWQGGELP